MDERARARLARKIDRLDHPDAGLQDAILDEFSSAASEVMPGILANIPLVNDRVRRALLRWLMKHHDPRATLPLMRYVFDERTTIAEQPGRAMAMAILFRRARDTVDPAERGRLRAFAEDLIGDRDPEVRRQGLRILTFVGDDRSTSFVEPALQDDEPEVRAAAHEAMDALGTAPPEDTLELRPGAELTELLRSSAGPLRRQYVRQWRRHPERVSIAATLLPGDELRLQALQILLEDPPTAIRPLLGPQIQEDPDGQTAALALRLLAALASQEDAEDLTDVERQAIERSMVSPSPLTRAAAATAAGALGMRKALPGLLRQILSEELTVCLEAARALSQLVEPEDHEALRELIQATEINEKRRQQHRDEAQRTDVVAHLQIAIRRLATPDLVDVESIYRLAINQLRRSGRHRPIRVTALQLLMAATPAEGLANHLRWDPREVDRLCEVLPYCEPPAARRLALILERVAPPGLDSLTEVARKLLRLRQLDPEEVVLPLLLRADTDEARRTLEEIASADGPGKEAAARILRERRNSAEVIDAEFIPRDKD